MSRYRYFHAAILAVCGIAVGGFAYGETLREAIEETLRTNPEIQIEVQRRLSSNEALDQARSAYFPRVDLAVGAGRDTKNNSTTRSSYGGESIYRRYDRTLTLTQMLFDGFATASEVERNQARTESSAHKVAATTEQISLRATEAYLEVLRQQAVVKLTQENLLSHMRTLDQIRLRASSGVGRKSDLDQIEARVALARSNLTAAEANLIVAEVNYKLVIGRMPKALDLPKAPDLQLIPKTPEDAVRIAFASNRILQSAKADVAAANAQHTAARAPLYPRLDLELGVQHNDLANRSDSTQDDSKSAMLRMRYNLFRGGGDMARIGETKHLAWEAQEILNRAERQLEQSVRVSFNAYQSAREKLPNLRKHAESSQLSRDAYVKQFGLGQRTLLDLLDTENEYFTATTNAINGEYVELFSRYRVLADMGQLLDALGVTHRAESAPISR